MLKILAVDDEPEITELLKNFFERKNYEVITANNGAVALEQIKAHRPHLVFLDIRMPVLDGLSVLRSIRMYDKSIKVIMVTALGDDRTVQEANAMGAVDYVHKPFNLEYLEKEVIEKVNRQLFTDLREELEEKGRLIEQLAVEINQVMKLNGKLKRTFYQTVLSLASALEARDRYTHGHSERVDLYSKIISEELKENFGWQIDDDFFDSLHIESRFHDIGKIAIPDVVLNKPGRLTAEEMELIKKHPVQSVQILSPLEDLKGNLDVILHHHERVDGKGYPGGLKKDRIPPRSRIIAVADSFDAMTSDRPYRNALTIQAAIDELIRHKGAQFDEEAVEAFLNAYRKGKIPN